MAAARKKILSPDDSESSGEGFSNVPILRGGRSLAFSNKQRIADALLPGEKSDFPNPVGAIVQAAITGRKHDLEGVIRNVMSKGADSAGGYTVPTILSTTIIDKARAASVMNQAGVQTFLTDSDNLSVAKVTGDPTVETKAENAAFTGSHITFGSVTFAPKLVGIYCVASRELAEDSINFQAAAHTQLVLS